MPSAEDTWYSENLALQFELYLLFVSCKLKYVLYYDSNATKILKID